MAWICLQVFWWGDGHIGELDKPNVLSVWTAIWDLAAQPLMSPLINIPILFVLILVVEIICQKTQYEHKKGILEYVMLSWL